jgi:hypothetical protein
MAEANANAEIAKHLSEHDEHGAHDGSTNKARPQSQSIEILEAIVLAVVAVVTAWSGLQSAKWDGVSAREYATSNRLRTESSKQQLTANQYQLYNTNVLNMWTQAVTAGNDKLVEFELRRFTPEYKVAFDAWIKTNPLTDPSAPRGPLFMPEYTDPRSEQAKATDELAARAFEAGVEARERAEHYVRITVLLSVVLFLIALGQRFKFRGVRKAVLGVAGVILLYTVALLLYYPRA